MAEASSAAHVLLVEDEESVRTVVARLLKRLGYRVSTAADAEETFQLLDDGNEFDLVLTDIIMPGLSGTSMAEILRERHPDLPFLFMSGYTSRESGVNPQHPPEPYLAKPFTIQELAEKVREVLKA